MSWFVRLAVTENLKLMDSLSPNATRIIDAMFPIIDADMVGCLTKQILISELSAVAERYVTKQCPHASAEQNLKIKLEIRHSLESTERDELIAIIRDWRKEKQPVVRTLIWIFVCCLFCDG